MFKRLKLVEIIKNIGMKKEDWEDYKKEQFAEIEEVDKYFEKSEKKVKPKLTDKEREYLSVVIKPFRNDVDFIKKRSYISTKRREVEYIAMDLGIEDVCLPVFEKGKYYQGLEEEREYTLEELGL